MLVQKRTRRRKAGLNRRRTGVSDALVTTKTLSYNGPLTTSVEQLVVVDLLLDTACTTTAGGVINDVASDVPSASPDWSATQALYAEYRVLAMTYQFIPNIKGGNVSTLAYAPFYVVWDATSSLTPLASYTAASNYPICKKNSLNQPWTIFHRMDGVEEGMFVPNTSTAIDYVFKTFATGLTASTNYGRFLIRWKTQFRGRL